MKKHLLFFIFALTITSMRAQNNDMYTILYHDWPGVNLLARGLMIQHDGDFIISSLAVNPDYDPVGNTIYKVSPTTLTVIDSLFVSDTMHEYNVFLTPNPHGAGNIFTSVVYHANCDSTFLHISHFPDNGLNINPEDDIVAPLCDGYAFGRVVCIDSMDKLILQYEKPREPYHYDEYAVRLDLDGTLISNALLHENYVPRYSNLIVLQESPPKYYQWTLTDGIYGNLVIDVLDTLFNKNSVILSSVLSEEVINPFFTATEYLHVGGSRAIIPIGGDEILVAAEYVNIYSQNPNEEEYGVAVVKYNLRTMQLMDYIVFNDYPGIYKPAECLGLKIMTDGTVYFLYKEEGYPDASFIAVKMDTNLNVEWKRFCKTDNITLTVLSCPVLCKEEQGEENGIAWAGEAFKDGSNDLGLVYFFLNHDGTVGVSEGGMEVRPYCFYPNPANDQLHLQYSPDVQPTRVELFDLQGRLVRTQSKAFESIDMSQLPAGTYTMSITLEDGKSYAGKVVKE